MFFTCTSYNTKQIDGTRCSKSIETENNFLSKITFDHKMQYVNVTNLPSKYCILCVKELCYDIYQKVNHPTQVLREEI